MADASCSGTTAFKRLVDHQSRDVSHHQDRLVNTSPAVQNSFRNAPAHAAQAQEQQFRAFSAGGPALPGMTHDPAGRLAAHAAVLEPAHPHAAHHHLQAHGVHSARSSPAPDVSNWAADFQRFSGLGLGPAAQGPAQQFPISAGPPATASQFAQPMSQASFATAFGQQNFAFPMMQNAAPMMAAAPGAAVAPSEFDEEMSRWMASYGGGAKANGEQMKEVDAMMDQVAHELELYEGVLSQTEEATATVADTRAQQDVKAVPLTDLETPEIGNLSLDPVPRNLQEPLQEQPPLSTTEQTPETAPAATAKSAVSEAAERLLESVQHEDGEKWKNSVFLSLMRDFRDGRKDIVDNEIRQTEDPVGTDSKIAD